MRTLLVIAVLIGFTSSLHAERPPQKKESANAVIVGVVEKIAKAESPFFGDGVRTDYTATIKVEKAEKGSLKAGDSITVKWFHITKKPSLPVVGAFGHGYPVKEKDTVRAWLLANKEDSYTVIYNQDGMEKVKN